jgi:hypothetical protein
MPDSATTNLAAGTFTCAHCQRAFKWKPELAGRTVKCKCEQVIRVPAQPGNSGATPAPPSLPSAPRPAPPPAIPIASASPVKPNRAVTATKSSRPAAVPPPPPPLRKRSDDAHEDRENLDDLADIEPPQDDYDQLAPPPLPVQQQVSANPAPRASVAGKPVSAGGAASRWAKGIIAAARYGHSDVDASTREQAIATFAIYCVGAILIGIGILGFSFWQSNQHAAFLKIAQHTDGSIVTEPDIRKTGRKSARNNPDNWYFSFDVDYKVDDRPLRNEVELKGDDLPTGFSPHDTHDWIGQRIDLVYDPANPDHVEAALMAEQKGWGWTYLVGAGFVAVGGYFGFKKWPG